MQTTAPRSRRLKTAAALAVMGALAGTPVLSTLVAAAPALARATPESFAPLIEEVAPAVVLITAKERLAQQGGPGQQPFPFPEQFPEGPLRDFFEKFFREGVPGMPPGQGPGGSPQRAALGSGFIIGSDGTIVTNNHVVGEAQSIEVTLKDGSRFPAQVVGTDDKTDLAVLKIDAGRPLPSVSWGDSETMRVGDWVVAVGNPFGLSGSATAGIISSRGRDIGAGPYDDFIQIDAPINTGNSGGPLFNGEGRVIGVNTAIYSPSGGNVGIGFAIPSNIAQKVVAELQEKGVVERGWLGIAIQPVTTEVAESLGLSKAEGALVANVSPDSPAAKAGLRQGDVVLNFDGRPIASPRELSRTVAETDVGAKKRLTVWRDGREVRLDVRVGEMPRQQTAAAGPQRPGDSRQSPSAGVELSALGLTLAPVDAQSRARWGISEQASGAVVASVDGQADAAEKGLRPGDVITGVNQQPVSSPADVVSAVEKAKGEQRKSVLLLVERQGEQRFVAVELSGA